MAEQSIEQTLIDLRKWKDQKAIAGCWCAARDAHQCYLAEVPGINPEWYKSRRCLCRCHPVCNCEFCELKRKQKGR